MQCAVTLDPTAINTSIVTNHVPESYSATNESLKVEHRDALSAAQHQAEEATRKARRKRVQDLGRGAQGLFRAR